MLRIRCDVAAFTLISFVGNVRELSQAQVRTARKAG
jgi:hypothetical protein